MGKMGSNLYSPAAGSMTNTKTLYCGEGRTPPTPTAHKL
jgi:hypothetical protein